MSEEGFSIAPIIDTLNDQIDVLEARCARKDKDMVRLKKQIDELKDENQRLMRLVDGTKEELRLQGERDQQEAEDAWDD